jgi:AraC-like DNA-binding protein
VVLTCGDKTYETRAGACVLVEPGVTYRLYAPGELVHNWLHLYPEAKKWIEKYKIPLNEPFYPSRSRVISEKFRKIEAEFYSDDPFKEEMLNNYIEAFWIWLHRSLQPTTNDIKVSHALKDAMNAVRMQLLSNPEKKWTLQQMASTIPLSPSRFHAVYKALFGTTPTKDMIDAKVHYAKTLLRSEENLSLKEIAEQLGYNDQYHFIRQFKNIVGQTPGAYRKRTKNSCE